MLYEERCVWDEPRPRDNSRILQPLAGLANFEWIEAADLAVVDGVGMLWLDVVRANGAVGFRASDPAYQIMASAAEVVESAVAGEVHFLTARLASRVVGSLVLRQGGSETERHCGYISRVMIHPSLQGCGLGTSLLAEGAERANSMGLAQLLLSVRDGEGLSKFYQRRGWAEVGRWLGGIELSGGRRRDEVWLQRHV